MVSNGSCDQGYRWSTVCGKALGRGMAFANQPRVTEINADFAYPKTRRTTAMPRKKNVEGELRKPLLRFERVVYEKASFRLRQDVLQQIADYVLYVKEVAGEEPTPDELVDRGMQRLFDADRGFHQWRQNKAEQGGVGARTEIVQEPKSGTDTFPVSVPVRHSFSD
jgi:hypothetical protein